jgi:hypothetical protein
MNRQQRRAQAAQCRRFGTIARFNCTPDNVAKAIVAAVQCGQPGVAELLRHVRSGDIQIVQVESRDADIATADLIIVDRPAVALVGDDDYRSTGPKGWRSATTISAWARSAVIHAAGATADTYREAVRGAHVTGRCALIETDAAHADAWAGVFTGKPVLVILPRDGVHPVMPRREAMQ